MREKRHAITFTKFKKNCRHRVTTFCDYRNNGWIRRTPYTSIDYCKKKNCPVFKNLREV